MPYCASCSHAVSKNAKFCIYCDAPLAPPETTRSTDKPFTESRSAASALAARYRDAYLVATITDGSGKLIKAVGVFVAILLILFGLITAGNGRLGDAIFAFGVVAIGFGVFSGVQLYLLGVLVSAQAQILKASLDSSVNTSPFLTNEQRAQIMRIPAP